MTTRQERGHDSDDELFRFLRKALVLAFANDILKESWLQLVARLERGEKIVVQPAQTHVEIDPKTNLPKLDSKGKPIERCVVMAQTIQLKGSIPGTVLQRLRDVGNSKSSL